MKYLVGMMTLTVLWFSSAHALNIGDEKRDMIWPGGEGKVVEAMFCEKAAAEGHFLHSQVENFRSTFWFRDREKLHEQTFSLKSGGTKPKLSCRRWIVEK